jgi:hypothetical protein
MIHLSLSEADCAEAEGEPEACSDPEAIGLGETDADPRGECEAELVREAWADLEAVAGLVREADAGGEIEADAVGDPAAVGVRGAVADPCGERDPDREWVVPNVADLVCVGIGFVAQNDRSFDVSLEEYTLQYTQ